MSSRAFDLHIDILEFVSSGASLGGEIQATLEAHLMETRANIQFETCASIIETTQQNIIALSSSSRAPRK